MRKDMIQAAAPGPPEGLLDAEQFKSLAELLKKHGDRQDLFRQAEDKHRL